PFGGGSKGTGNHWRLSARVSNKRVMRSGPWHRPAMAGDRKRRGAEPAPDAASLHDAALNYLARYAATEVGLRRVLERRVERWARMASGSGADRDAVATQSAAAKQLVREVVSRLVAAAAVNDVTFAQSRSRSLV